MSDQGLNDSETCKGLDKTYPSHTRVITYLKLLVFDKHVHLQALKPEIVTFTLTVVEWIPFSMNFCPQRAEPELISPLLVLWELTHS